MSGLDEAWAEAEAALPEGWVIECGNRPDPERTYWAQAIGPEAAKHPIIGVMGKERGASLAEVLLELAAKLRAAAPAEAREERQTDG